MTRQIVSTTTQNDQSTRTPDATTKRPQGTPQAATEQRYCRHCGKPLARRKNESQRDYQTRVTCNQQCSTNHRKHQRAQRARKACQTCGRTIPLRRSSINEYAARKYCTAECRKQAEQKRQHEDAQAVLSALANYRGLPLHAQDLEDELGMSLDRVREAIRGLKKRNQISTKPNPDFAPGEPHTLYFVPAADGRPTR